MLQRIASISTLTLFLSSAAITAAEPKPYQVQKLADGVYAMVWNDAFADPIESNSLFIINDADVIVVESSVLPSTARVIISEIRKLTSKPVRLLINSHWHDDHVLSNSVFRDTWPGIEFVGHRNTRTDSIELSFGAIPRVQEEYKSILGKLRDSLASGKAMDGKSLDEARRKRYEEAIALYDRFLTESAEIRPLPPELVFDDAITIHRGARTIEVRHLGRGNTRGDVIVWLPQEKILATGDLVVYPIPFAFGSYYGEWVKTLDRVLEFPAETIFLSHGPVHKDKEYVRTVRGLLDALVTRVGAEAKKGTTVEDTKKKVTLDDWKTKLAADDADKRRAFDAFLLAPAIERAWWQAMNDPRGFSAKGVDR
jgi:glyoxylase-like metal-dependent hydrolase (beta-lactamase superfamily II)